MEEKKELLDQDERVVEIELERLRGFVNHPFKVQADSQMIELQESIKKYGILNPLIVRPRQDGTYEIISGHRRKFAAEKIGYRMKKSKVSMREGGNTLHLGRKSLPWNIRTNRSSMLWAADRLMEWHMPLRYAA